MEPLKQWVCDVCGKIIETPDDGYVVWGENAEGKIDKIRILHKNNHVGNCKVGCDHDRRYSMSLPLESFLGDEGKVHFLFKVNLVQLVLQVLYAFSNRNFSPQYKCLVSAIC